LLSFTARKEDKIIGSNPKAGRFFTSMLAAIAVSGVLSLLAF
jgi:hypothetical protein